MSDDAEPGLSRRQLLAAGTTGLIATAAVPPVAGASRRRAGAADGTPEQVHLTWGDDPARSVVVSWASPGQALAPRVRIGQRVIPAVERGPAAPRGGQVAWTYHALVDGLRPGATYGYAVTADNDRNAADPFSATFRTAPEGRAAFRFTSFGDLAAANARRAGGFGQSADAVGPVEAFQPLFHLLNADLADADLSPAAQPQAWRDFGNSVQASAANRPWMPVPGGHGAELADQDQALASYLARYTLPGNGAPGFEGRWYEFRVGTAAFICLSGDDVKRGYSAGAQTRWLEATLAAARRDASIDWVVVQLHQCACSSAGAAEADLGLRQRWLPVFDRYEVDLVVNGHDHDYERSYPVRGFTPGLGTSTFGGGTVTQASGPVTLPSTAGQRVNTFTPSVVTTDASGPFDTSKGTVYMVLGGGGTDKRDNVYGAKIANTTTFTQIRTGAKPTADSTEPAAWSAMTDPADAYGVAHFQVDPGEPGENTTITVTYYHAPTQTSGSPDYSVLETFQLTRPRRDRFFGRLGNHEKAAAGSVSR